MSAMILSGAESRLISSLGRVVTIAWYLPFACLLKSSSSCARKKAGTKASCPPLTRSDRYLPVTASKASAKALRISSSLGSGACWKSALASLRNCSRKACRSLPASASSAGSVPALILA
ncbi:MAG: hypothetical protein ACK56F_24970, partial [bacterium]